MSSKKKNKIKKRHTAKKETRKRKTISKNGEKHNGKHTGKQMHHIWRKQNVGIENWKNCANINHKKRNKKLEKLEEHRLNNQDEQPHLSSQKNREEKPINKTPENEELSRQFRKTREKTNSENKQTSENTHETRTRPALPPQACDQKLRGSSIAKQGE